MKCGTFLLLLVVAVFYYPQSAIGVYRLTCVVCQGEGGGGPSARIGKDEAKGRALTRDEIEKMTDIVNSSPPCKDFKREENDTRYKMECWTFGKSYQDWTCLWNSRTIFLDAKDGVSSHCQPVLNATNQKGCHSVYEVGVEKPHKYASAVRTCAMG